MGKGRRQHEGKIVVEKGGGGVTREVEIEVKNGVEVTRVGA